MAMGMAMVMDITGINTTASTTETTAVPIKWPKTSLGQRDQSCYLKTNSLLFLT